MHLIAASISIITTYKVIDIQINVNHYRNYTDEHITKKKGKKRKREDKTKSVAGPGGPQSEPWSGQYCLNHAQATSWDPWKQERKDKKKEKGRKNKWAALDLLIRIKAQILLSRNLGRGFSDVRWKSQISRNDLCEYTLVAHIPPTSLPRWTGYRAYVCPCKGSLLNGSTHKQ